MARKGKKSVKKVVVEAELVEVGNSDLVEVGDSSIVEESFSENVEGISLLDKNSCPEKTEVECSENHNFSSNEGVQSASEIVHSNVIDEMSEECVEELGELEVQIPEKCDHQWSHSPDSITVSFQRARVADSQGGFFMALKSFMNC